MLSTGFGVGGLLTGAIAGYGLTALHVPVFILLIIAAGIGGGLALTSTR